MIPFWVAILVTMLFNIFGMCVGGIIGYYSREIKEITKKRKKNESNL